MNKKKIKRLILKTSRIFGIFALARYLTRNRLCILAYHGASLLDEAEFRAGLFMTQKKFDSRLEFLEKHNYSVVSLAEALKQLNAGKLPRKTVVLTIDDGWLGTRTIMAPALKKRRIPATLYLSSYYMNSQTQVFNVVADYVLWKSRVREVNLSSLGYEGLQGVYPIHSEQDRLHVTSILWNYSDSLQGASSRQELFRKLCNLVKVKYEFIVQKRLFTYMSSDEAAELVDYGVDVQLHTHRHRFIGVSKRECEREIEDNRRFVEKISSTQLEHFCYPSGEYTNNQIHWLKELGITSATTTKFKFNSKGGSVYELGRFLDSELISELEFEASVCGFFEVARWFGRR